MLLSSYVPDAVYFFTEVRQGTSLKKLNLVESAVLAQFYLQLRYHCIYMIKYMEESEFALLRSCAIKK